MLNNSVKKAAAALALMAAAVACSGADAAPVVYNPSQSAGFTKPASEMRLQLSDGNSVALLGGYNYYSGTVIGAYQKAYAMNFEIWKPVGMPAGWYATFDGFPVAQAAENVWVYGKMAPGGAISPTNVLVGSVVPMEVPALTRVASTWVYHDYINNREFCMIKQRDVNRMGFLDDPLAGTPIAWSTDSPGVYVWLADHWARIMPLGNEYTWQALNRKRGLIIHTLREKGFWWRGSEPNDLADIARRWGYLWMGRVKVGSFGSLRSGNDEPHTSVNRTSSPASPEAPAEKPGGNWDVGQ